MLNETFCSFVGNKGAVEVMNVSDRIKIIYETDFSSQDEFAKMTGVSRTSVNMYINNKKVPSFTFIENLYKIGYNINWLLSGDGFMKRGVISNEYLDQNLLDILIEYGAEDINRKLNSAMEKELYEYIQRFTDFKYDTYNTQKYIRNNAEEISKVDVSELIKENFFKVLYIQFFWDKIYHVAKKLEIKPEIVRFIYEEYENNIYELKHRVSDTVLHFIDIDIESKIYKDVPIEKIYKVITLIHLLAQFKSNLEILENTREAKEFLSYYLTKIENNTLFKNELIQVEKMIHIENTKTKSIDRIKNKK